MPEQLDPMTLAMLSGVTPGQPDALATMRKYALAQQLQQMSLGGAQQPQQLGLEGTRFPHAARVGPLSAVAPLLEAVMAQKGFKTAGPDMARLMGHAYGMDQPQGSSPAPAGGGQSSPAPQAPQGPNPYAPVTQQDIAGTQVPGANPLQQFQSRTSLEGLQKYRELQLSSQKQQHTATIAQLDSLIKSDHPAQYAQSDQNFMTMWPNLARQMNLDPTADFNDQNVRRALGQIRNPLAASVGVPEEKIPEQMRHEAGDYGQSFDVDPVTGERKQVSPREMPSKVGERYDPEKDESFAVYKNWFFGNKQPPSGTPPGTGGPPGTTQVPMGRPAPNTDQTRAAGLAMSMRSGLENIRQLEQKGFNLTPSDRAAIVGVISEQGGVLGGLTGGALSSLPLQEMLAHKLSPQGQQYLAGLMPVLQGIGHHLGGARLNDVQIKALLESVAPINTKNKAAMEQINTTRDGYYSGLLAEAGPARELPVFGGALKNDYAKLGNANSGITKTIGGKTYISLGGGRWREQ